MVKRLVRSTSVPIADRPKPMIKSPSQCPGALRASISGGLLQIINSSLTWAHALAWHRARGTRKAPPGAQITDRLSLEGTSALNVQGLVDGFVRDTH